MWYTIPRYLLRPNSPGGRDKLRTSLRKLSRIESLVREWNRNGRLEAVTSRCRQSVRYVQEFVDVMISVVDFADVCASRCFNRVRLNVLSGVMLLNLLRGYGRMRQGQQPDEAEAERDQCRYCDQNSLLSARCVRERGLPGRGHAVGSKTNRMLLMLCPSLISGMPRSHRQPGQETKIMYSTCEVVAERWEQFRIRPPKGLPESLLASPLLQPHAKHHVTYILEVYHSAPQDSIVSLLQEAWIK